MGTGSRSGRTRAPASAFRPRSRRDQRARTTVVVRPRRRSGGSVGGGVLRGGSSASRSVVAVGHPDHGALERLDRGRRRRLHAADLAHVLTSSCLDLLGGRSRLETPQGRDVAAHAPRTAAYARGDAATVRVRGHEQGSVTWTPMTGSLDLEARVAELTAQVEQLIAQDRDAASRSRQRRRPRRAASRRNMLKLAGAAAVGAVVAVGRRSSPAAANDPNDLTLGADEGRRRASTRADYQAGAARTAGR